MPATTPSRNGNGRPSALMEAVQKEVNRSEQPSDPLAIDGTPPNRGQFSVPHMITFQSLVGTLARVYRPSDEALRHSRQNARAMRNDIGIMECIEARQRAAALLDWQLVPEDTKSASQKAACTELTKLVSRIPRFTEYRRWLLEGCWFGKSAIQHRIRWGNIGGFMRLLPMRMGDDPGWLPIHGDKLVFRYDDGRPENQSHPFQVGIRVGRSDKLKENDTLGGFKLETIEERGYGVMTADTSLAYFLPPWQRELLSIHKHMIEDGDYFEPLDAGRINGVGIRDRIYWEWFQKQETLAFLMEYLERSAGGIEIWEYPAGNPDALAKVKTAAKERIANGRNVIFFPKPVGEDSGLFNMHVVEPGMGGIDILQAMLTDYFGARTKRYILGQTLTSEASATGLGSGLADLHLDTFMQIVKYDVSNLDETLTEELIKPLIRWNRDFKDMQNVHIRFESVIERPDMDKKLGAFFQAWQMGARIREADVLDMIGAETPTAEDKILPAPGGQQGPDGGAADPNGEHQAGVGKTVSHVADMHAAMANALHQNFGATQQAA